MTGSIVLDFFIGLGVAGIGGTVTYFVWRLATDEPGRLGPER